MDSNGKHTVLILGGAGFIGSNIAKRFYDVGCNVIVIDGLLNQTSGRRKNLKQIISDIQFIKSKIEDVHNLDEIVRQSDIIVDCMAWTSHHLALKEPIYDLKLNAESHLYLIQQLKKYHNIKIIYLGSRSQYGNPNISEITEDTPMVPDDIQGIHKLVAESYYRIYSKLYGLNVISIRFPNCFGKNQPTTGNDIGLVGSFIRDILASKIIEVYGIDRKRYLVYVKDLAEVVFKLSEKSFTDFKAFNLSGHEILIEELIKALIEIIGKGRYVKAEIPHEVKVIDIGSAKFSDVKLQRFLGGIPKTNLKAALCKTVSYFKENM